MSLLWLQYPLLDAFGVTSGSARYWSFHPVAFLGWAGVVTALAIVAAIGTVVCTMVECVRCVNACDDCLASCNKCLDECPKPDPQPDPPSARLGGPLHQAMD